MSSVIYANWSEEIKCAYAGGIIDGEGSIGFRKDSKEVQVQVGQSVKGFAMLDFLHSEFGGLLGKGYSKREGNRQMLRICFWTNERALEFLTRVEPYIIFKSEQAELAMRYCRFRMARPRSRRYNAGELEFIHETWKSFRFLNRKGKIANEIKEMPSKPAPPPLYDSLLD